MFTAKHAALLLAKHRNSYISIKEILRQLSEGIYFIFCRKKTKRTGSNISSSNWHKITKSTVVFGKRSFMKAYDLFLRGRVQFKIARNF